MRVANVIRRFVFEEWGGTECAVWNLSKRFCNLGHTAEILSTKALCNKPSEVIENIKISRYNYFYPYLFLSRENFESLDKKGGNPFSFGLYRNILKGGFDVVHSHTLGRIAKESVLAAKKLGVPSVLTFHGGYGDVPKSEIEGMQIPTKGKIAYGRALESLCGMSKDPVAEADGIICVGKNEFEKTLSRFPYKEIEYIPNGVNFDIFANSKARGFREKFNIPNDRKLLLCVSRIDPQKNQLFLLKLLDKILALGENVHLALVGFVTNKHYFEKINIVAKELNISHRITICCGLAPDSEMLVSAYKSADVFVLPSVHEPFGIVAIESWAAGTAVIASNVGGLSHIIRNGENGFLFSSDSLDEAVLAYFNAKKFSEEITSRAREECRLNYSWEFVAEKTLCFYDKLKNGNK